MPIYTSTVTPPTPPTADEIQQEQANLALLEARVQYERLCELQRSGIARFWKNPKATPQQISDKLGTAAGIIFEDHGALTNLCVQLAARDQQMPNIDLPTNAFTINPDKTVTIHAHAYGTNPEP